MKFIKHLFTVILGTLIAMGMSFFLLIGFLAAISEGVKNTNTSTIINDNSILRLDISGITKDYTQGWDTNIDFDFWEEEGLNDILSAIENAKTDPKIMGISIPQLYLLLGYAQVSELRDALADFKTSGKFVYAHGEIIEEKDYYLRSIADSIFIVPMGILELNGLSSERLFYKKFQEKTGVKMIVIRHGKYKSAVEPYLLDKMSPENRAQISELLNSVWETTSTKISESRDIPIEKLNKIVNDFDARTSQKAIENRLIDGVFYPDEYESFLKQKTGVSEDEDLNYISLSDYYKFSIKQQSFRNKNDNNDKIAVIYAEGVIQKPKGGIPENDISYRMVARSLHAALKNKDVKGIVLRVNSPGGDALESDLIWREVVKAKEQKPVYISMGNLAASGGYYISAGADKIFAEETTITGSIGVFGTLPNVKKLADNIGINSEQVSTHAHSNLYSIFEPMPTATRQFITEGIERIYDTFLQRVAKGRNMRVTQVDSIAQGRVWAGAKAKQIGLVDEIGGLDATIKAIASDERVNLTKYSIINYPKKEFNLEYFFADISTAYGRNTGSIIESKYLDYLKQTIRQVEDFDRGTSVYYTQLPYYIEIK